jgi:signal peptidase I
VSQTEKSGFKYQLREFFRVNRGLLIALAVILFVRGSIVNQYLIPSGSMIPTLIVGDRVLVNRIAYDFKLPLMNTSLLRLGEPKRGDIVVFVNPSDGKVMIKRLIGIPGDEVQVDDGLVKLNGEMTARLEELTEDFERATATYPEVMGDKKFVVQRLRLAPKLPTQSFVVGEGEYLMLGDNRDNSQDSRFWGLVPRELLIGRAFGILMSFDFGGANDERVQWQRFFSGLN